MQPMLTSFLRTLLLCHGGQGRWGLVRDSETYMYFMPVGGCMATGIRREVFSPMEWLGRKCTRVKAEGQ